MSEQTQNLDLLVNLTAEGITSVDLVFNLGIVLEGIELPEGMILHDFENDRYFGVI